MSDFEKCFARPKVRFSKSAESPDGMSALGGFKQKPTVRSVTSLRPQIKILKAPLANNEFGWNSSPEEISTRRSGGDSGDDEHLRLSKTKFLSSPDSQEFLSCPENPNGETECFHDTGSSRTSATIADHRAKTPKSILAEKKPSSVKSVHFSSRNSEKSIPQKIPKSSNDENNVGANLSRPKTFRCNKENIPSRESSKNLTLKVPQNTPQSATSISTVKSTIPPKNQPSVTEKPSGASILGKPSQTITKTSTEVKKKPKLLKKVEEKPGVKKLGSPKKPAKTTLMACMKSARPGISKAPIKKTIVRDASTTRSKIQIGPGMPRSRTPDPSPRSKGENNRRARPEIHSADKLAHPEFNSITCTMRQLREAQKEKIVPDIEHLPAFYRRLINGKVFSTLDRSYGYFRPKRQPFLKIFFFKRFYSIKKLKNATITIKP